MVCMKDVFLTNFSFLHCLFAPWSRKQAAEYNFKARMYSVKLVLYRMHSTSWEQKYTQGCTFHFRGMYTYIKLSALILITVQNTKKIMIGVLFRIVDISLQSANASFCTFCSPLNLLFIYCPANFLFFFHFIRDNYLNEYFPFITSKHKNTEINRQFFLNSCYH